MKGGKNVSPLGGYSYAFLMSPLDSANPTCFNRHCLAQYFNV